MENIKNLTELLAEELKSAPAVVAHVTAREVYESDEALLELMAELRTQRRLIATEYKKEERDEKAVEAINSRIDVIYKQITASTAYTALENTHGEMNKYLQDVYAGITATVTGKGGGCGSGCGSCGGCG